MLQTLHRHGGLGKPVYGMKLGGVGFLMNHDRADDAGSGLLDRIAAAQPAVLRPLERSEEHTSELQPLMRISYAAFCWKQNQEQAALSQYWTTSARSMCRG